MQRTIQSFRVGNYQKLYLRAEDALGNTFTSLEGLRFRWNIVSGGHALGMPKTRESLISLTQPRREIEASGYHSDVILVEGKATGVANVTAVIEEPGYENVPLAWTLIYVSEPFGLIPSAIIYLPPRAVYEFKLYKMQD